MHTRAFTDVRTKTPSSGFGIVWILLALLAAMVLFSPVPAGAGFSQGNIAIAKKAYDQQNPFTIYLPDKNLWFVVWEDWSNITKGSNIKGKFINSDGTDCGGEIAIFGAYGNQTVPWAAYRDKDIFSPSTGKDSILISWQDTSGASDKGYVSYTTLNVDTLDVACSAASYTLGSPMQVGYNEISQWDLTVTPTTVPATKNVAYADGSATDFSGVLRTPVTPGSVTVTVNSAVPVLLNDDGKGGLTAGAFGYGSIDYITGALSITLAAAPAFGDRISASYEYTIYSSAINLGSVNDGLLSRKSPKVSYDPVRDTFWIVWTESRNILNRISEVCYGSYIANWEFGDSSFVGYVMIDGATFAELANSNGVAGADIIRDDLTRTNRLMSHSGGACPGSEVFTYEFFTSANNPSVASDTTSPETFAVWEGIRFQGTLICTCTTDIFGNIIITDTFGLEPTDDGSVHIYGLFDKEIPQNVTPSRKVDASTVAGNYPSIGFDPVSKKFFVAWEDLRNGPDTKIFGQFIYTGGGFYNQNFIISYEDTDGDGAQDDNVANSKQTKPFVSYDAVNQRFFVVWQDGRNSSLSLENLDIYGQKIDAEGSLRGSNYPIFTQPYSQYAPSIAYNDVTNEFFAVWKDARNTDKNTCGTVGTDPCGSDVYGQRFTLAQPSLTLLNMDNTQLTPSLLNLFENPAGTASVEVGLFTSQSFRIRNTGDTTLKIDYIDKTCGGTLSSIAPFSFDGLPTELSIRDGVTLDLVPSGELVLTVRFTPLTAGSYNKCFIIESDGGKPQVNLSALAIEANIVVTPKTWDFKMITIGDYKDKTFIVTNMGLAALRISAVEAPPIPFSLQSDTCSGSSLSPGSTCTIGIRYTAMETEVYTKKFRIYSNDPDRPVRAITVSGGGVGEQHINVSPVSVDFGSVQKGRSSENTITITNDGLAPLTITSISSPSLPFTRKSNNCPKSPATLGVNESCQVVVEFAPILEGTFSSKVTIASNDPNNGSINVALTGKGAVSPAISIDPVTGQFGTIEVGSPAVSKVFTVKNIGTADLSITGITSPAGDFSLSDTTCFNQDQLVPDDTCTVTIAYAPTTSGFNMSSFALSSNDPLNPVLTVSLIGFGSSTPKISVSPTSLKFGPRVVNTTTDKTLTVTSSGTKDLIISSVSALAAPFSVVSENCSKKTLTPKQTCQITVRFTPTAVAGSAAVLKIRSNDPAFTDPTTGAVLPKKVNISGQGVAPQKITVSPAPLTFDNQKVGTPSSTKTVTVTNDGGADLVIYSVAYPISVFKVTGDTCKGATLKTGEACKVTLEFRPAAIRTYSSSLTFTSDDPLSPITAVTVTGTGTL